MSTDSDKLIAAIQDQTQAVPYHMVFVIDIVSVRFGGFFTPQIKAQLEKYINLQMLTLNDCGIKSLVNFPNLQGLIRLDMVFNQIKGQDLQYLAGSRHLQTLMLGANQVQKLQDLNYLKHMKQLLQLDLINNPIQKIPGYRVQVFNFLPTLTILDTLDKGGKDAYNNASMMQTVSRIPDNLFDKSIPIIAPKAAKSIQVHKQQKKKLINALARTDSLDKPTKTVSKPSRSAKGGKAKMVTPTSSKSKSSRAGLVFPVGRLKRKIKESLSGVRVGVGSAVYLAATLEYLAAELLEIAGNEAKNQKKSRITPLIIKNALKNDQQLNRMFKDVTIGMLSQ